jgi:amino acid adenylation domain-containing protein
MPVSPAQERLWLLDRAHPGTAACDEPHEIRLRGSLEEAALAAALSEIVHRHEVLRTVFREHDGEPAQIVQPWAGAPLPKVDLSGLPETVRETAGRLALQAARRPLNLQRGPMLRALLLRLDAAEHVLLLQIHPIATDGWSLDVLDRELVALYHRFAGHGLPLQPLPPLPLQYADFAVWQRRWLAGPEAAVQLAAWSHRLAGLPAAMELPADRSRPAVRSFRGAVERTAVTPALEAPLAALGHRVEATFSMTLLAAFQTLLHRLTGRDDLAVGMPVANRSRPELQGLIGLFANRLVLRADLAGDPPFVAALGRVREAALFAQAHQELPFERLAAELAPEREVAHSPIFQVLFSLAETPPQPLDLGPDLRGEVQEVHDGTARLDLSLRLSRHAEGLTASLEYAGDLFDQATAVRLLALWRALLEGIAAAPEARLSELPLLSPVEREQVLCQWNQTATPIPDLPVHRLFEAHARRAPEALAVSWSGGHMTYGELDRRASRLAGRLRRLGVGPESVVAVLFERSPELVLAVLATAKAGGAWLPIDPAYPGERIATMLGDSGAVALLTGASQIPPETPLEMPFPPERVLRLDSLAPEEAAEDEVPAAADQHPDLHPDQLAYVIYTSGSTGTPKGTEVRHRGLANLVAWYLRTYALSPADRSALVAGPSFDASVFEMWPALAAGASLYVPPAQTILSPPALLAWLAGNEVTVAFLPTPLAEAVLAEPALRGRAGGQTPELALRLLMTGGDRLLRRPAPGLPFALANHYGPAENTVVTTAGIVAATGGTSDRRPDIGIAIDNTRVYLLDRTLRPVPLGVPGELCAAGEGLARGYRGRPELTAERFVPNPVDGIPGARLYRTGDLARRLPDGSLEFLGRIDRQVKIRGVRIELGEIESALAAQPEVAAAAVLVREEGPGSRRLAGYVVATEISSDELRARLARLLPAAMVPSAWVFLDALPLTPNGKVDRTALARIPPLEPQTAANTEAPRTPSEQLLADLFREVLTLDQAVGAHDDFFQLGGHSLLVFQLAARMRTVLGVDVDLRTVFEHPTVASLAGWIADPSHGGRATATIVPIARGAESPLSFAQQRLWFLDRFESGGTALYNVPVVFRLTGPGLRVAPLAGALDEIVRRHEALRTVFRESGGEPVQVVQPFAAVTLPVIDLSGLAVAPVARTEAELVERELADRPFDLVRGPLLRCCLLRLDAEEHHLVVAMHHIAADGWSLGVLAREISELYRAFAQGLRSPLPPLPVQYADFAIWQRRWLAGEVLEAELAGWRERLAGLPPALELPADRPRPARQSFRGDLRHSCVEPQVGAGLAALSRHQGATLFMTLAAAFYSLLSRYTGEEDLVVGTPIAGRNRAETAGLIGFFVNTLVLRTSLAGDPIFLELLARVRTMALDAFAHQDLPFERLVAELAPQRDPARTPLFQVMFALWETAPDLDLGSGLTGSTAELPTSTAKWDLFLQVARDGDELRPTAEYATDLFDAATVDRLLAHLGTLLAGIAAAPETRLSELPLLPPAEREQILHQWNRTAAPILETPVQQLFEAHARRAPEALAVSWSGGSMTYAELDRRANQWAHRLRGLGVRPESVVALLLERSAESVIAVVATVKAGGAWMPIDPVNPGERIATMLRDSGATVLLTTAAQLDRLPDLPLPPERVLRLDEQDFPDESTAPPVPFAIDPDHLAYVIYTSGSTGMPKGAALTWRGLANLVNWDLRTFERGPQDRAPLLAGPGFDASVWEIWPTLAAGASLHVPSRETILSPPALLAWLAAERITLTFIATPLAVALLEEMQTAPSPPRLTLRALLTGGDRLVRRPWPELTFPLINMYGPTETTVYATGGLVTLITPGGSRPPHIGTALDNTRIHLVDRHLRPVPVGLPGELYIAGAGLARGYRGRPELTAERFVPNPLDAQPGQRMYRTGDLARWLPGGEIEFLGRIDHQVKIRGIRIELGEIESELAAQPEIAAAVVTMREDAAGDRRLVAYVVASGVISPAELRERLARRLPAAMVPAGWIFLDALPLNPNGKLDRRALERMAPEPEAEADAPTGAPQTPIEQLLADLVREVLKLERPAGSQDDFFHLGGHSLLVVQLASRAAALFGVDVDIRTVFDHPTVAGLAGWIAEALRGGRPATATTIVPVARGAESPLSFAQQRLWFLDRFESSSTSLYNVPVAFHLAGPGLRVSPLAGALDEIVRRHEALRTVFRESADGEPVQVVQPFVASALPVVDLSGLPVARAEAERVERELADRPFDLVRGPLLRCCLLRLGAEEHHLVVAMHHIAADGWSLEVLAREIAELYQTLAQGLLSPLSPLPVQYADFAIWQRRWLAGEVLEAELAWWRERLAGLPPALELPADRPRPARQSFRGDLRHSRVEPQVGAGLAALGRRHGATLFMTLTAAFHTLLCRYTGEEDLAVGTPVAGRNRAEIEGLIGFFVNTLVLRTSLAGDPSFLELLARVRTTALDAYAHQDLPFEQLVAELAPQRDLARTPLFQVLLAVRETELPELCLSPGLAGPMVGLQTTAAKFDLALQVSRNGDELRATAEYATDLFDAATVDRLLAHLSTLLAGIAAAPETPLSLLPLLTAREREQLAAWNATGEPRPAGATLHGLFAAQAARTPDALAVIAAEGSLTYRELDARSGRLARRLVALGAGIDSRVGLFLERSLELVVGLLGVLKAGAAYVPLDPDYPAERLAAMLEDTQAVAVLAQQRLADRLPAGAAGAPVLFVEEDLDLDLDLPARVPDEAAAYLIFTSGSTGRPKATVVPHRAIVNYMLWMLAEFPLEPGDRVLQKTAFSFDASVWEFWAPLLAGSTLVMARPGEHREPAALIRSIREHGVTVLPMVPAQLRALLEDGGLGECRSLRRVFCGGEALGADLLTAFFAVFFAPMEAELTNLYGPTETTVAVTFWRCERGLASQPALLGRAIPNARLHVLGPRWEPCPVGVPGELFVGGVPVSRGYLGRAVETASSFLPDPFAAAPGERLYRTGDRVRRRPDGLLEYLGRADHQVKVRGFRIELGEVEAALATHPAIAAAVALVREIGGEQRVLACVKPAGEAPAVAELRAYLERRLPAYMLPSGFSFLDELPLLPNGKVDRRALLAREPSELLRTEGGAPRTETEKVLAGIWKELLGIDGIGLRDDFFHLGGHSLLVMRLTLLVRKRLAVDLDLRTVFEETTLGRLAARIERHRQLPGRRESGGGAEIAEPGARPGAAPLSYAQQRLWFLANLQPGLAAYNLPVLFGLAGPLAPDALAAALSEVVRRHGVLRTTFAMDETSGEPVQAVAAPTPWPLPRVDLSDLPAALRPAEADRLLAAERRLPFDLAHGPLLRSLLVRLGPQDHRLALTMHHIVFDGWSISVLRRELQALYGAAAAGGPSPLPELPFQYTDFSVWQRHWLAGGELEAQLAWWRQTLAGTPPALDLLTDRPRPAVQSLRGGMATLPLGPALSAAVEQLGQRRGTTRFMTLLAAFKALLFRYTGQEDLWVGTPIANRSHDETEELIGFFVNTLVLRTGLGGDPTFAELLGRVRETALAAYEHQDLPFEKLVEELAPARDLSRSPLFQVMFSIEGERTAPAEPASGVAPGVSLEPLDVTLDTAKFDLTLMLEAGPEGLEARVDFAADLFDAATAGRLLAHFRLLLTEVATAPESRIAELSLLAAEERAEVVAAGRPAAAPIPGTPVHRLFEAQARRAPEALAVASGGQRLTYGELDRRANRLAHRLRKLGARPESVVAILLERSAELVIAVLATVKAGGAWLPIDPAYPGERIATMLRDAGAVALLTAAPPLARVPDLPLPAGRVLRLDEPDVQKDGQEDGTAPPAPFAIDPDHLAYVIYTSGSTGTPKGSELTHRALRNLIAWHQRTYGLGPADRATLIAGPAFDASIFEMWPALAAGASLHVPPRETLLSPAALLAWLAAERITVAFLPTPLAETALEQAQAAPPPVKLALRVLATGGDRLLRRPSPDLPFALANHYGPTETTVVTTAGIVAPPSASAPHIPDLGAIVDNTQVYLVDPALRPVPVGLPGELCIAGAGLARGYRGRPDLTAERFVPNPLADGPGERLYHSGDLARWLPGGLIEFLGRIDHQVKLRGVRIELSEIESVLAAQPEVAAAVVVVVGEKGADDRRLVAYVVAPGGVSAVELRERLARRLPAAMVPADWVFLDALPLTPNGKVDRRALPAPLRSEREFVAPRTPLEELVAGIWRTVLKVDRVGADDNFWNLGGHSLIATKVLARVRDTFGIDLPLQSLFTTPQLAEFAAAVGEGVLAAQSEDAADLLSELDGLSEEEIRSLLAAEVGAVEELT